MLFGDAKKKELTGGEPKSFPVVSENSRSAKARLVERLVTESEMETIMNSNQASIQRFADSARLPTLPEIAMKLVEIAQQEEPDYNEVSRIIRSDPVVSGKILKTVNSALFGFRQRIETIEQAIPKLGITLLRTIILGFHLANHRAIQGQIDPVLEKLWRSSLTQAVLAELIAEENKWADPSTYFLAAMLQDIGILAMVSEAPVEYLTNVLSRAEFPNVVTAERNQFGISHVDVSVEILNRWGLGANFGAAVKHHHDRVTPQKTSRGNCLVIALQAASLGAAVLFSTRASGTSLDSSLDQWIGFLRIHFGFSTTQAEEIISEVNQRVMEYSCLFSFQIGDGIQTQQVVAEAKQLLQEIALNSQLEQLSRSSTAAQKKTDDPFYRDELSGLLNRRFMNDHLNDRLAGNIKKKKSVAFLFLDVDKFKEINDNHGHSAGDKAIRHVADWLNKSLRKNDLAIRLGGDEFLVVLQQVSEKEFEMIAQRITSQIPSFQTANGRLLEMSLSLGAVFYQPIKGDFADANWLIDQADQSMYRAKKEGGDAISVQKFVGMVSS